MLTELQNLLHAIRQDPDADIYLDSFRDMLNACADYVRIVSQMESYRILPTDTGAEYRDNLTALDKNRTLVHNDLISKVIIVNRVCARLGLAPLYTGSERRSEYGDFAQQLVNTFFDARVR